MQHKEIKKYILQAFIAEKVYKVINEKSNSKYI